MIGGFLVGLLFGFTLHRTGLVRYSRIIGALLLKDFKAMKFMFFGLTVAMLLYGLSDLTGIGASPRVNPYMGKGHIIGGVIFGIGMAIGGLCPGTCAARLGGGKWIIGLAFLGILFGAWVFDLMTPFLEVVRDPNQSILLPDVLGVSYWALAIIIGTLFLLMVLMMDKMDPARKYEPLAEDGGSVLHRVFRREWSWQQGGFIAGLLIYFTSLQGQYLSFASAYSSLLGHILAPFGIGMQGIPELSDTTAWRAAMVVGVIPGAFLSSYLGGSLSPEKPVTPLFREAYGDRFKTRLGLVFLSGVLLEFGANIGGGCTTGAFMSGWPTLSLGNLVMGMTFFITAMAVANAMYWGKRHVFDEVRKRGLSLEND